MGRGDSEKEKSMRVVFLDFDGVLNNRMSILRARSNVSDEIWDPKSVMALNHVLHMTNAVIVVSSAWRNWHGIQDLRGILLRMGVEGEVIDVTPDYGWNECRGNEIKAWLRWNQHRNIESFVILDDNDWMGSLSATRLVKTEFHTGLTMLHADKAVDILMTPSTASTSSGEVRV